MTSQGRSSGGWLAVSNLTPVPFTSTPLDFEPGFFAPSMYSPCIYPQQPSLLKFCSNTPLLKGLLEAPFGDLCRKPTPLVCGVSSHEDRIVHSPGLKDKPKASVSKIWESFSHTLHL